MTDHDPFNNPEIAHPRARELMVDPILWDCADDSAPFGSDQGNDAYYFWREWRQENPTDSLTDCFDWILDGQLASYNEQLATKEQVAADLKKPRKAFLAKHYDMFTLDVTIIATGLGQLIDEGTIESSGKPYLNVAIARQRNPGAGFFEAPTLDAISRVVAAA